MSTPIQFTNRNGAGSESLKLHTQKKFENLYKFAPNITKIHVTFNTDHLMHIVDAEIHIPKMKPIFAEAKTEDMYKSIDLVIEKLTKQMAKHKEKISEH